MYDADGSGGHMQQVHTGVGVTGAAKRSGAEKPCGRSHACVQVTATNRTPRRAPVVGGRALCDDLSSEVAAQLGPLQVVGHGGWTYSGLSCRCEVTPAWLSLCVRIGQIAKVQWQYDGWLRTLRLAAALIDDTR